MRRTVLATLLLAFGLAIAVGPASALQVIETHTDKNTDGTTTYHFAVKTDPGETVDFVTVYNFGGLVDGSGKSPAGWTFSSPEFGRTPTWNGYPVVLPVDIPQLNNVTWTAESPVGGGKEISGFSATTRATGTIEGEYTAEVTRAGGGKSSKQAIIGHIPTPSYSVQ
jgi:hypothetical protein